MMMDCIIRRKRVLTIIVLAIFFALGARAQEDEDIAHSLNLTEVVEMKQKLTDKQIASFLKPDLFLLSHGKAKLYIDKEKWPQGFVSLKLDYDYK